MVTLRPMTDAEFTPYMSALHEGYAKERAESGHTPLEEERVQASEQIARLLPDGLRTPGHFFWHVIGEAGEPIGHVWVYEDRAKHTAFIYDIELREDQRGKGLGKATLAALEDEVRPRGITRIALNVFARNTVARALYERVGYYPVATFMQKDL